MNNHINFYNYNINKTISLDSYTYKHCLLK